MAPRKQAVNVSVAPTAPEVQSTPVAAAPTIVVQGESEAQKFARLSNLSFGQLGRDDRRFLDEYSRKQDKALDGSYETIAIDPTDAGRLQLDIRCITIGPNTKKTADGRPYLFSLDGFEFAHQGKTWAVGAFYAVEKKAKA